MKNFVDYVRINEEGEGGTPPSTNSMGSGAIATTPTPMSYSKRRFANKYDEYEVNENDYNNLKYGRANGDKWSKHNISEDLEKDIRKSLYKEGAALVTNQKDKRSVILRHLKRLQQFRQDQDTML